MRSENQSCISSTGDATRRRRSIPRQEQQQQQQQESTTSSNSVPLLLLFDNKNQRKSSQRTTSGGRRNRRRMIMMERRRLVKLVSLTVMAMAFAWVTLFWQQQSKYLSFSSSSSSWAVVKIRKNSSFISQSVSSSSFSISPLSTSSSLSSSSIPLPSWIEAYTTWHAHQLMYNASDYPFLVYTCAKGRGGGGCGGIGDRLNGMIQAFYTAMCNQRVFLIEYDTPYQLNESLWPRYVQWNVTFPTTTNSNTKLYQQAVLPVNLMDSRDLPMLREPLLMQESAQHVHARGWLVRTNLWMEQTMPTSKCLQHYIRHYAYNNHTNVDNDDNVTVPLDADDLYRWAFHALFQMSDAVVEQAKLLQYHTGLLQKVDGPPPNTTSDNITTTNNNNGQETVLSLVPNHHHNSNNNNSSNSSSSNHNHNNTNATEYFKLRPYVAMHVRTGRGSTWQGDPLRHLGNETFSKFFTCAKRMQQRLLLVTAAKATHTNAASAADEAKNISSPLSTTTGDSLSSSPQQLLILPSQVEEEELPIIIYVASDNDMVKQYFRNWDEHSFRYPSSIQVIHADKSKDPSLQSYLDIWAELLVLMQAKALVMSVSKFSQVSEVLGRFTNETARYFDQCDFDNGNGDNVLGAAAVAINETIAAATAATITANTTTAAAIADAFLTATPTHHDHRDQADEKYIEHLRKKN